MRSSIPLLEVEMHAHDQDDTACSIGGIARAMMQACTGIMEGRRFAPHFGVVCTRAYGKAADHARWF
ncbi:MAG: hypothetical protein IPH43_08825 [Xanthomonadales bacterium]|uniref:hypothetical protein n=1 Tax=Dokdonella sp. TaxID=2291710 RepID=UPI0031C854A4|nr:hypothetical protein [Xanthomonadales bacterium]